MTFITQLRERLERQSQNALEQILQRRIYLDCPWVIPQSKKSKLSKGSASYNSSWYWYIISLAIQFFSISQVLMNFLQLICTVSPIPLISIRLQAFALQLFYLPQSKSTSDDRINLIFPKPITQEAAFIVYTLQLQPPISIASLNSLIKRQPLWYS